MKDNTLLSIIKGADSNLETKKYIVMLEIRNLKNKFQIFEHIVEIDCSEQALQNMYNLSLYMKPNLE